jgi:FlaA1/EpsC-like NDP-sugar epimerase/lipopolysaccharide/colanic/teichoic acid biosynthesis glycosyltransferase/ActR/RegA family two-component response regulator
MLKRSIDLIVSFVAMVILLPVLFLVAIAIKLDSRGPAFYSQVRVGRRGRTFKILKFRSMVADAARLGPPLTGKADPRVTRVGRFLRLLKLDELPQLFNVLKGDMSLVGPRPEIASIVEQYTSEQREGLEAKPGMTGPTQLRWISESEMYPAGVNPFEHYTKQFLQQKLRSDLEYVRTRSLRNDLQYLIRTPLAIATAILARFHLSPTEQKGARLMLDCLAIAIVNLGAFMVRFDWAIPEKEMHHFLYGLPVACVAYFLSFLVLRTYRSLWRYASVEDLWLVIKASALGGSLNGFAVVLLGWRSYPRSVLISTALLAVLLMGGMRLLVRWSTKRRKVGSSTTDARRVVIVGAGETGESIARAIRGSAAFGCDLIGFVDDDPKKQGATIHGLPVLGPIERLADLAGAYRIQEAIIAIPSAKGSDMRRISRTCAMVGVSFKTFPSLGQLMRGDGKLRYLREVNCDDLLRRERMSINELRIIEFLQGKRVMVTGAGGSIGAELCRQVLRLGAESLIMVERAENALYDISLEIKERYPKAELSVALADVKHVPRMSEIFRQFRPHIVFHAAAYKHVPILEDHPGEAVLNNVIGTKRLSEVAMQFGAETFVLISTDKAVEPNNLMGATKRICEMYITALSNAVSQSALQAPRTRFLVVRFGNVLGSNGSVVPLFQKQIENGGPITITDPEVSRFFMTVSEAVGLVLQSASMAGKGEIFVFDMGEPVKITELADDLALSLGLSPLEVDRRFVGLRPGDKMREMLWEDGEEVLASEDERIFAIRSQARPLAEVEALVNELESLALRGNVRELLRRIQDAVPSYRPAYKEPQFTVSEHGEKYRILVIDDDENICDLLRDALEGTYEVSTASSAGKGLDQVHSHRPHLVLLDIKLPDESGVQVCRTLRSRPEYSQTAIIMMTGYGDKDSVVMGLQAGADDYVSKPFRLEELQARIDAVLRRSSTAPMVASQGS